MGGIPSPAQVAAQYEVAEARRLERERVKVVRKRRRLARGSALAGRVDAETTRALVGLAFPDVRKGAAE